MTAVERVAGVAIPGRDQSERILCPAWRMLPPG